MLIAVCPLGLSSNRNLLAAEVEMAIEHRVDQLAALTAILLRNRNAADLREKTNQLVVCGQTRKPVKKPVGNAGAMFERDGSTAHE